MADPENTSIARTLYENWNKREFDQMADLIADDGEILLVGSGTSFRGPDGAKEFAHMWADAFSDGRVTIENIISGDDRVMVEHTGRGTQTGTLRSPGGEIPATGKSVTLEFCDVLKIEGGKIKSVRSYFDSASLLMQIGVMPEVGVAAAGR